MIQGLGSHAVLLIRMHLSPRRVQSTWFFQCSRTLHAVPIIPGTEAPAAFEREATNLVRQANSRVRSEGSCFPFPSLPLPLPLSSSLAI